MIKQVYKCEFVGFVAEVSVLKKALEVDVIKIVQSFDTNVARYADFKSFPNRRLERSKTNISRHIFIITGVIAVELKKRNIRKIFLHN